MNAGGGGMSGVREMRLSYGQMARNMTNLTISDTPIFDCEISSIEDGEGALHWCTTHNKVLIFINLPINFLLE